MSYKYMSVYFIYSILLILTIIFYIVTDMTLFVNLYFQI